MSTLLPIGMGLSVLGIYYPIAPSPALHGSLDLDGACEIHHCDICVKRYLGAEFNASGYFS